MFKWAVIFLIISLVAGAFGLTNISLVAKRVSIVLFVLFFIGFLVLLGFAYLLGQALSPNTLLLPWPVTASWPPIHLDPFVAGMRPAASVLAV